MLRELVIASAVLLDRIRKPSHQRSQLCPHLGICRSRSLKEGFGIIKYKSLQCPGVKPQLLRVTFDNNSKINSDWLWTVELSKDLKVKETWESNSRYF